MREVSIGNEVSKCYLKNVKKPENSAKNFGNFHSFSSIFTHPCVSYAPNVEEGGSSDYQIARHVLLAHARAYHLYHSELNLPGKVGITLNMDYSFPRNEYKAMDWVARERELQFTGGWWANPVYVDGNWPEMMIYSNENRQEKITLPELSASEQAEILGTSDFFGLNHYTSRYLSPDTGVKSDDHTYFGDKGTVQTEDKTNEVEWEWDVHVPEGLYELLKYVDTKYSPKEILITENGNAEPAEWNQMRDVGRVRYMMEYLSGVHKAIEEGVNVVGYTMWSLMDNFEWSEGYSARFGLLHVDFNSASRTRTPKQSFYCYQEIVANNYVAVSLMALTTGEPVFI